MKTLLIPVNRWPGFIVSLTLAFAGSLPAQSPFLRDDSDDPQYSDAYRQRLRELRERVAEGLRERQERIDNMRERGEQIRQRLDDEYRQEQERKLRERREELERSQAEARANVERLRYGYGTYLPDYGSYRVPQITPVRGNYYRSSRYSYYSVGDSDECHDENKQEELRRQRDDDEGFAAASGKCGDVTTQKIGNFFYHSDGTVTQKVGDFFYGPDGQVTQKVGNFYYHSDGTTTQRVGNFYYDSDGGVTQKIGSFYYHSGGKPCEDEEAE